MSDPLTTLDRLCIHTITTKPWSLAECIDGYNRAGVGAVTVWRNAYETIGPGQAGRMLRSSGLRVVSVCRGGFFPAVSAEGRQKAIDENRRVIDEAAALGAPLIVLVCGAVPGMDLIEGRRQIADGIAAVLPHAADCNVRLAIEPLHPMYADDRSAINTMAQANEIAEAIDHPHLGIAVDVYHLWWDPTLEAEIRRAGDRIFAFHVCDWRTPTRDLLNDRGQMGEGCIPIRRIRGWVEAAGFNGPIEVEIFSNELWAGDQAAFVDRIKEAWLKHV
jgi:sugar phosphate isomerase/epimerase